jgi:hypothetical protein
LFMPRAPFFFMAMRCALYLTGGQPMEARIEWNAIEVHLDHPAVKLMVQGYALCGFYQVGYFLSPFDFLKELFTFFLFRAAFNRFVFPRLFIIPSFARVASCRTQVPRPDA